MQISGLCALLLAISLIPAVRLFGRVLRSPSAWFVWLAIFLIAMALRAVIDELCVISFYGAAGNALGAVLWAAARPARSEIPGQTSEP